MIDPQSSYLALLVVQAAHLLHHRIAKRHISFVEVVAAAVLCFPPAAVRLPALLFVSVHVILITVQAVGSIWIKRLSPNWTEASESPRT